MAKTVKVIARIDPELKEKAEALYSNLGMTLEEAITVFFHRSVEEDGIPFDMHQQPQRSNIQTETAVAEPAAEPVVKEPVAKPATAAPEAGANDTQQTGNPE